MIITAKSGQTDWASHRDGIDLVMVVTRHLGPAPGRPGTGRLWWVCPFHQDKNPSLQVKGRYWKCFGCGSEGDAVDLVRKLDPSLSFSDAVRVLTGGSTTKARPMIAPKPEPTPDTGPGPEWQTEALEIIAECESRLWGEKGYEAVAYLKGRGLTEASIRAARLGLSNGQREGVSRGITIPWFDHGVPRMIQVRRKDGCDPKYMATKGSRRGGLYPDPAVIKPGKPVVIVEGEFDALVLGRELQGIAAVVTIGSASERPKPNALGAMLPASPWYVATDADDAGSAAAAVWPSHARRIRPPACFKDWTEAHQSRVNLRRWWGDILSGNPSPPLHTWEELASWRWGPAIGDPTPGIIIDTPLEAAP